MLRTVFFYLFFYPWTLIVLVLAIPLSLFGQNVVHSFGILWGRGCLLLAGLKLKVYGTEHVPRTGPAIYVSNHQSNFDIPILYAGLPLQFRWMAKQELFNVPLFGLAMRRGGYIPIDRSDHRKAMHSIMAAAQRIKQGASVIIFPEGTRTPNGQLQKFKKGALLIAAKAQVPVVPVAIRGSYLVQPKGRWKVSSAPLELEIFQPIATVGMSTGDIQDLTDKVHDLIAGNLQKDNSDV